MTEMVCHSRLTNLVARDPLLNKLELCNKKERNKDLRRAAVRGNNAYQESAGAFFSIQAV